PVIKFLGHIIDGHGIRADPQKIEAIVEFPVPTNITELQRFLGMVNQLAKFSPELASQTEPLLQLLKRDSLWSWSHPQEQSFQAVKKNLTSTPVLAHYCAGRETIIAADASNAGLGAVFLQIQPDGSRRPVSYISRSLTPAEKNYAAIEKEALAATWASERFSEYTLGSTYTIETDHRPLVPLLTTKELYKMPPRIQRFRLPSSRKLQDIITQQKCDPEIVEVRNFCHRGWPAFLPQNPLFRQYWVNQRHLTIVNDLLLFNNRIVIPTNMRLDMLNKLHESHLGVTKCRALAETSVWWPNISSQIEDMVRQCNVCAN
ncbi:Pol polyprotein, partial [Plakobranchus ocellatus]